MKVIEQLRTMSEEQFLAIYDALSKDGFGPLDGEVARALKFRPQAIKKLPFERRAKKARNILDSTANAELCYEVFGSYLMATRKQLVIDFLDQTDVEHEDGMIRNIDAAQPAGDKVAAAVAELDKTYEQSDVTLYLSMCAEQWPGVSEIESIWRMRV